MTVPWHWPPFSIPHAAKPWLARYFNFTYGTLARTFEEQVDPWRFDVSCYEQERFRKMLQLVCMVPHESILEVGCAEGHFTQQLLSVAAQVTALDLSGIAIERAKRRATQAQYVVTKAEEFAHQGSLFDVVVCGEMLYYLPNAADFIARLGRLGRYLVVSNCNLFAYLIERKLRRYQRLRRIVHYSVWERQFASISLWRL